MSKKVAILTGGGDCPGLNPTLRGAVKRMHQFGYEVYGIRRGWRGLLENEMDILTNNDVSGILAQGGTILRTSRTNPFASEEATQKGLATYKERGLDALVAIGGEDTLGAANKYSKLGMNVVGVPKTIDNDLSGTDWTFGFYTAIEVIMDSIDRLYSTASSHDRVIIVEVMGRHAGWLATVGGLAGGADYICIPERPIDLEDIVKHLKHRHVRDRHFSVIVVAEGAQFAKGEDVTMAEEKDEFGHVRLGGIAERLAGRIEKETGFETRHTVLGHIQRGGAPCAFDRVLSLRYGVKAAEMVRDGEFGKMAALVGNDIKPIPLDAAVGELKLVDDYWYELAEVFFG